MASQLFGLDYAPLASTGHEYVLFVPKTRKRRDEPSESCSQELIDVEIIKYCIWSSLIDEYDARLKRKCKKSVRNPWKTSGKLILFKTGQYAKRVRIYTNHTIQ